MIKKVCFYCNSFYDAIPNSRKYCSRLCSWKDKKGTKEDPIVTAKISAAIKKWWSNESNRKLQQEAHIGKNTGKNPNLTGEKHYAWKGSEVGYRGLHLWVTSRLGRPRICAECGYESDNTRQFHWANISHQYRRDLEDWIRLCVKCHIAYDKSQGRWGDATRKFNLTRRVMT